MKKTVPTIIIAIIAKIAWKVLERYAFPPVERRVVDILRGERRDE